MILALQRRLSEKVGRFVKEIFGTEITGVSFQYPPRPELGDLALTLAFDLAKSLKKNPREIAVQLAEALRIVQGVDRAEVAGGGYVNVFLDRSLAYELAGIDAAPARPGHVIVEHTSINPNKAAHIGHLRNAVLGDSFVRILRSRGHGVGVQNYIDDTGVQVADVVVGFRHLEKMDLEAVKAVKGRFDYHCWDLYARVSDFYAADPKRRSLQAETLHSIEHGENDTAILAEYVSERIVSCHLATMERIDVRYDLLAHERDILRLHFWERAFGLLKEKGAIRLESEGKNASCWVLSMESGGADEDKIIVRSDGTVTYTGKDIAYQLWKLGLLDLDFRYRRYASGPSHVTWTTTTLADEEAAPGFGHAQSVFNVIDVGQSYPQRVVRAGVAALDPSAAERSYHLAYEKVVLSKTTARALGYEVSDDETAVKVSGRKGLGVKADDLLDLLYAKALGEIEARDPSREGKEADARAIATGALRYFLLKYSRTTVITFDMDEALAFVGETGPYIQNSVVRARNIFVKMKEDGHSVESLLERARAFPIGELLQSEEGQEVWSLLVLMSRSDEVAEQAIAAQEVSALAKHAFAVAQAFHSYYQKPRYSVLHAESERARGFRSWVVSVFLDHIEALAALLGIPIPERM